MTFNPNSVKTRFAPSPTGEMHFGNVRTALFNVLVAIKFKGSFLLRLEDTDEERSSSDYEKLLYNDLKWLSLAWQEGPDSQKLGQSLGEFGPYRQSDRKSLYEAYYKKLLADNNAYYCFCSEEQLALRRKIQRSQHLPPRYEGTCSHLTADEVQSKKDKGEKPTIRFRIPKGESIVFNDLVKGQQIFHSDDIGDFIIIRACGTSSFMFCNAIDDSLMGVTHAIRGEDHLTNTPRQLMILKALDLRAPEYGHISLILGHDGSPLSKRNGSKSVKSLREVGYLPQAINNYLARLGHQYDNNLKFSDLNILGEKFSFTALSKSPAHYDEQHLNHWQKEAVLHISTEEFKNWVLECCGDSLKHCSEDKLPAFLKLMQENITFPSEVSKWAELLFTDIHHFSYEQIDIFKETGKDFFKYITSHLDDCLVNNSSLDIKKLADNLKAVFNLNGKKLFMPLRVSLTLVDHGPELVNLVQLIGLKRIKDRIDSVIKIFDSTEESSSAC